MLRLVAIVASIATARSAPIYASYQSADCHDAGHGGTPASGMEPMINVSAMVCEQMCNNNTKCTAIAVKRYSMDYRADNCDCYFQAAVNLTACDYSSKMWFTLKQTAPPPKQGLVVYHLFEPKYTGLANKDAGDFKGDTGFIFETFSKYNVGNPEASMESNIIEMSEITVKEWGEYEQCNAPGAHQMSFSCPANQTTYCCTHYTKPVHHTKSSLPGVGASYNSLGRKFGFPGWWFSFPMESENITWTQKTVRRIAGLCVGNAWRKDAGGCSECATKWDSLDSCVADCIQRELVPDGDVTALQATWDRVFANATECPEVPFKPAAAKVTMIV